MESTKVPAAAATDSQLHFLDYWRIIRIRKTVILAVFLLVVLTTTAVTFVLQESFCSTVRIAVEKTMTDIDPLGRTQGPMQFDPYFIQTEFEKIQSKSILYPVIEGLGLNKRWATRYNEVSLSVPETYLLLRKNLDVRQSRNTSLIEIRAFSEDRNEAAEIANKIAEVYREARVNVKRGQAQKAIEILETQLTTESNKVEELQKKVDEIRTTLKIPDSIADAPSFQASLERETVSGLEADRIKAQSEYVYYQTRLARLQKLDRKELRRTVPTVVPTEVQLPQLLEQLANTEQRIAGLLKDYSPEHPEVLRTVALQTKINEQIEERLDGILTGLDNQVSSLKARVDDYAEQVQSAKQKAAEAAANSRPYFQAKRDMENRQRIRDAILLRTLQERVDSVLPSSSVVEVVDRAEPGLRPVRPNIPLNIALGVIVGLVMGVGLAFFIEYLDTSVKTIDDVERSLSAPVLGVIPQNVGSLLEEGPDSPHAEAYRVLRTNVMFSRKDSSANSLTVVSGGAGEGKSTTIFNLATVFAQSGQRVLVVDSDLRRPSLHKFLNITNSIGLTNYLLKQNTLEEVIQTTKLPTMDFLPSGKLPSSSLGVLNSLRMKEFVKDVKSRYDFVFFDSPPIMGVSDASILASEVDLALLVVQYRKYPQAMTLRAKQMVEKVGGTMLGVVLNNINISQDSYYYYYSGYYYDYYSKYDRYDRYGRYGRYDKYDKYDRYEGREDKGQEKEPKEAAAAGGNNGEADKPAGEASPSVEIKPKY
jgi:capsular exopolysaccharide synthesis family protein